MYVIDLILLPKTQLASYSKFNHHCIVDSSQPLFLASAEYIVPGGFGGYVDAVIVIGVFGDAVNVVEVMIAC